MGLQILAIRNEGQVTILGGDYSHKVFRPQPQVVSVVPLCAWWEVTGINFAPTTVRPFRRGGRQRRMTTHRLHGDGVTYTRLYIYIFYTSRKYS